MSSAADSSSSLKTLKSLSDLFETVIHASSQDVLIDEDPRLHRDDDIDESTLEHSMLIKFVTQRRNNSPFIINICDSEDNLSIAPKSPETMLECDEKLFLAISKQTTPRKFSEFSTMNKHCQNKV